MSNPFFGTGYKKKELNQTQGYMKVIKGTLTEDKIPPPDEIIPEINSNVALNVMGKIYEGKEKIEVIAGDIIFDGVKAASMPITSGTCIKIIKGKKIK